MKYAVIALLLVMSAFFSSVETAFSSVNRIRLRHKAAENDKRAERALKIAEEYDRTLTTILVGNNIVNILSASLGTIICTELFGVGGVGISTAVMTVLVLVFGEILPKSYAKSHAESFCLRTAGLLNLFIILLSPVSFVFGALQRMVTKKDDEGEPSVTEDELKDIIEEIEEEGVLEEKESDIVRSALEIDEISTAEILVPRVKIVAVEQNDSIEHIREIFFAEQYSRLPVYDGNIDNITGFIHFRDFFRMIYDDPDAESISSVVREIVYVTEFMSVSEVLTKMQKAKTHMAVIKDQYGGTLGLVTLEDLIEEVFGEIYDEADEEDTSCVKTGENEYEVAADHSVRDFEEKAELEENTIKCESVTVGGWVMEISGKIPRSGEVFTDGRFEITVIGAEETRVDRVRINIKGE